jgi:uncharacterized protein (DUF4415 family)
MKTKLADSFKVELKRLAKIPEERIDYSDIPPLTDQFWETAIRNPFHHGTKQNAEESVIEEQAEVVGFPPLSDPFWIKTLNNPYYRPTKQATTVRIDSDVLAWLKSRGRGYQTKINSILRGALIEEIRATHEKK